MLWNTAGRHGSHSEIPARKTRGQNTWFAKESEPGALLSGCRPFKSHSPARSPRRLINQEGGMKRHQMPVNHSKHLISIFCIKPRLRRIPPTLAFTYARDALALTSSPPEWSAVRDSSCKVRTGGRKRGPGSRPVPVSLSYSHGARLRRHSPWCPLPAVRTCHRRRPCQGSPAFHASLSVLTLFGSRSSVQGAWETPLRLTGEAPGSKALAAQSMKPEDAQTQAAGRSPSGEPVRF